jgi:hypothetical protein
MLAVPDAGSTRCWQYPMLAVPDAGSTRCWQYPMLAKIVAWRCAFFGAAGLGLVVVAVSRFVGGGWEILIRRSGTFPLWPR